MKLYKPLEDFVIVVSPAINSSLLLEIAANIFSIANHFLC